MATKAIRFFYLLLFLFTPLIFTSVNSELFQLPKMYFVYSMTLLILSFHLINFTHGRAPLYRHHPINIPLFLFLLFQTISTIFSIDTYTSIFGYYSRLNGGLLSFLSYSLLFLILQIYINPRLSQKIINTSLVSGLLVSLYAIAQHFGIDKHLWVQDVQNRVFASLGQPNWLAAYLCLLLPLSLAKIHTDNIYYLPLSILLFLALLFTKSKSGLLAAAICLPLWYLLLVFKTKPKINFKLLLPPLIFIIFSLTINNPIKNILFPPNLKIENSKAENSNITPSQDIRKIVWQGAWQLSTKFPLLGTGPETFAYSYYWVRPTAHNLTSEWDFLYNKAHNEYLNFLATSGFIGLAAYLLFIFFIFKTLLKKHQLLNLSLLTSILAVLITNFAGFSTVTTNLYLFLLPCLILPLTPLSSSNPKNRFLYLLLAIPLCLLIISSRFFLADIAYAFSKTAPNPAQSHFYLQSAIRLSPHQPLYHSQMSLTLAQLVPSTPADQQSSLINQAILHSQTAINTSPVNINFYKTQAEMYYLLATIDPAYLKSAIASLTTAAALAPTDAKIYYLLGLFSQTAGQTSAAVNFFNQAISLKNNYDHAHFALGQIYFNQQQFNLARQHFQTALDINPKNSQAQDYLNQINQLSP